MTANGSHRPSYDARDINQLSSNRRALQTPRLFLAKCFPLKFRDRCVSDVVGLQLASKTVCISRDIYARVITLRPISIASSIRSRHP